MYTAQQNLKKLLYLYLLLLLHYIYLTAVVISDFEDQDFTNKT